MSLTSPQRRLLNEDDRKLRELERQYRSGDKRKTKPLKIARIRSGKYYEALAPELNNLENKLLNLVTQALNISNPNDQELQNEYQTNIRRTINNLRQHLGEKPESQDYLKVLFKYTIKDLNNLYNSPQIRKIKKLISKTYRKIEEINKFYQELKGNYKPIPKKQLQGIYNYIQTIETWAQTIKEAINQPQIQNTIQNNQEIINPTYTETLNIIVPKINKNIRKLKNKLLKHKDQDHINSILTIFHSKINHMLNIIDFQNISNPSKADYISVNLGLFRRELREKHGIRRDFTPEEQKIINQLQPVSKIANKAYWDISDKMTLIYKKENLI